MGLTPRPLRLSWLGRASAVALAPALCVSSAYSAEPAEAVSLPEVTVSAAREGSASKGSGAYKRDESANIKNPVPLQDAPATIKIIPGVVMEERGATGLAEALRGVAGLSMAAGEGGAPNGDNLTLRGFNARNDFFIDGARDVGGYFRDTFNTESVEVTKGPASVQAGRGSTGGVINRISKAPKLKDSFTAELSAGTDETKRAVLDVNHKLTELPLEGAALRLNLMAHESALAGRDKAETSRLGFAPSLSFGLGTETRLTLSYLRQQERNEPDYGVPYRNGRPLDVPRETFFGFVNEDYERVSVDQATATLEHDVNDAVTVRNTSRYSVTDREALVTRPRVATGVANTIDRTRRYFDTTDILYSNQTDLTAKFNTFGLEHTFAGGVELMNQLARQGRRTYTTQQDNLFNPDPFAPYTGTFTTGPYSEAHAETYALYAQDTLKLNDKWQITGGLRQDFFDSEYDADNGDNFEREDRMLSKKAGVVYKPTPSSSLYASYGTSFNPSAEAVSLTVDNAALKPEKSRSYEAGYKQELLNGKVSFTTAVFRTEKTNARTSDGQGGVFSLDGEQHVDGIEFSLDGELAEGWQTTLAYAYMKSKIDRSAARDALGNLTETGKEIANVPDHSFSVWTTYELPKGWQIGGGLFYVGERYNNNANEAKIDGYVRLDGMVAYEITENVQAKLNLYNITDEFYYDRVLGGHAVPGAGRSALLSLAFEF